MPHIKPVGLCLISPAYEKVGREAVRRFKEKTGLQCVAHRCPDGPRAFEAKLNLDRIMGRKPFVFFDSDLWLLRTPDLTFDHGVLMACHDSATMNPHAFPHTDCERFGMNKTDYINSGLMVVDTRNPLHRKWFQTARALYRGRNRAKLKPVDWTDQFWLNLAKQRLNLPWFRLPSSHNFYLLEAFWGQQAFIPREIVGLHGAGIKARSKYRKLKAQAAVFDHPVCAMHPEAVAFEMARMIEIR